MHIIPIYQQIYIENPTGQLSKPSKLVVWKPNETLFLNIS